MRSPSLYSVLQDHKLIHQGDGYEVLSKAIRSAIYKVCSLSQLEQDASWDDADLEAVVLLKVFKSKPLTKIYEQPKHAENAARRWLQTVVKNEAHDLWCKNDSLKRRAEADQRHIEFIDEEHVEVDPLGITQRELKTEIKARDDRFRRLKKKAAHMLGIENYQEVSLTDLRRLLRDKRG